MSEAPSKPAPKTESKPAKAEKKSEAKTDSKSTSTSSTSDTKKNSKAKATTSVPIKNGKGSAPRNMGPEFLSNFDAIRWDSTDEPKLEPGKKFIKKY